MRIEYGPAKDATNTARHGLSLAFEATLFDDPSHLVLPPHRLEDNEARWKVIGMVDGRCYTAVHVWRGESVRLYRCAGAMPVKNDSIMALPADPNDPEDFDVSAAGLERGLLARELRRLRTRLGLNQAEFADRYGIPEGEYAGYEGVRVAPPTAVMAYLRVIVAEPEVKAQAVRQVG